MNCDVRRTGARRAVIGGLVGSGPTARRGWRWRAGRAVLLMAVLGLGLPVGLGTAGASTTRGSVFIRSDNDFLTCGCVTSGDGSAANPYVIGPYQIGVPSNGTSGYAVKVGDSTAQVTKAFRITGISIGYTDTNPSDPVIWLDHVSGTQANPISVSVIDANNDGQGVEVDASSWIALSNLNINKMNGAGVVITDSTSVTLANSKLKATSNGQPPHTEDGVYALDSSNLSIGGVPACPKSQICNSFDYDSGWGVYLQNSSNVIINEASANADDTAGFVLDNSSGVMLTNSTAQGDGPICLSVNGARVPSGYVSDLQGGILLINGSSNNVIGNDQFAADPGREIGSGGDGAFNNPCTKTQDPFSPKEAGMGLGNSFPGTCFKTTDIAGLPPNPCK